MEEFELSQANLNNLIRNDIDYNNISNWKNYAVEERSGLKIACLEEIALNNNWIKKTDLENKINNNINNKYYNYLRNLINDY